MRRISRRPVLIAAVVLGIPVLALAWWLGSPLFITNEVDEEFPVSAGAAVADDTTQEEAETEIVEAATEPDVENAEEVPESVPDALELAAGVFSGADAFHEGSGRATIYELGDGQLVLRFEDFMVTNGPDLHVLLVPDPSPESRDEVEGYIDLGTLKGNVGDQNYEVPADMDIAAYGSVVIYCEPFHIIFATATLS